METRRRQNQQRLGHVRMLRERSWTKPRERERGNQSEGEEEAGELFEGQGTEGVKATEGLA